MDFRIQEGSAELRFTSSLLFFIFLAHQKIEAMEPLGLAPKKEVHTRGENLWQLKKKRTKKTKLQCSEIEILVSQGKGKSSFLTNFSIAL